MDATLKNTKKKGKKKRPRGFKQTDTKTFTCTAEYSKLYNFVLRLNAFHTLIQCFFFFPSFCWNVQEYLYCESRSIISKTYIYHIGGGSSRGRWLIDSAENAKVFKIWTHFFFSFLHAWNIIKIRFDIIFTKIIVIRWSFASNLERRWKTRQGSFLSQTKYCVVAPVVVDCVANVTRKPARDCCTKQIRSNKKKDVIF